jgi:hypothetical protein
MRAKPWAIAAALLAAGLLLSGGVSLGEEDEEGGADDSVRLEDTPGTDAKTLIISEDAKAHIDIQTEPVREIEASRPGTIVGLRLAIPHSAVLYDAQGDTWVYVSPAPDRFVRKHVIIDFMNADHIFLSSGVTAKDAVVTVGVPELQGAEFGVGEGE